MPKKHAGSTPATVALKKLGVSFIERRYSHDPAETNFGREAAGVLGVEPERVFKTLLVEVEGPEGRAGKSLAVAIVPVTGLLDLKALANARGGKRARMVDPAIAERKTGYVVGGISPFGQRTQTSTVLDSSAKAYGAILVSGGRRGFELELEPDALLHATGGIYAAISRPS